MTHENGWLVFVYTADEPNSKLVSPFVERCTALPLSLSLRSLNIQLLKILHRLFLIGMV